ncbi:HAD family hydrolase [Paracoccaceae bacterium]|nr:HAD family hydrolase [Paracoccaceae bacterium]
MHGRAPVTETKKIAFLDRDGVINVDFGYVHKKENFMLVDGFLKGAKYLIDNNFELIVITNQAGIARSYYSESHFIEFSNWVFYFLKKLGVNILATYYCPHHPDFTGTCECRKPSPKMILQALKDYNVLPNKCLLIGDKSVDQKAATAAEISRVHLISASKVSTIVNGYSSGSWHHFITLNSQASNSD